MLLLMEALAEAGDDVAVATGQPLLGIAEADGMTGYRAGLDGNDPIVVDQLRIASGLAPTEIRRFAFTDFFVRVDMPPRLEDLDAVFESFRPDLVAAQRTAHV